METGTILMALGGLLVLAAIAFIAWRVLNPKAPPVPNLRSPRQIIEDFNPELPAGGARVIRREPRVDSRTETVPAAPAPEPVPVVRKVEQTDMFGDVEIPAAEPAPAREIQSRGELPRREPPLGGGLLRDREPPRRTEPAPEAKRSAPEEVVVVHVMGGEARIAGKSLLQSVLDCGLRFGEYNIFHRYESGAHDAAAMFSMANAVEPGVFDLDAMESQTYVGVSFFLMLPGPNSKQALDLMIEAARRVARDVGGELHDQQHSVLTVQTAEHLRQRVMEFERRRLAQQRVNG
ncbi:MAG: cell division protein ZipA [Pseudomonadota bacterium]